MEFTINLGSIRESPQVYGPVNSSEDVYSMIGSLSQIGREVLGVLYLDVKNNVLKKELHSIGGTSSAPVYVREICRNAILCVGCESVVLVHNHLSGDVSPGLEDREITDRVKKALDIIEIKLLDHVIISGRGDKYYSFADRGDLDS